MSAAAPARVARRGGAVKTFDTDKVLWKKVHLPDREGLARLILPYNTRLVYPEKPSHSWNGNKLRAEFVVVDDIQELDGESAPEDTARAPHARDFTYTRNAFAFPDSFSDDTTTVDAPGIHCYATREGARYWGQENYER